jgi:hypothetical protein
MNYASVVFVGFLFIAMAWYVVWGRKNYVGPALESLDGQTGSLHHESEEEFEAGKC